MQLAVEAQKHGNYDEARKQVVDVLRVDPKNSSAAQFAMVNDQLIEASRGTRPSAQAMERQKETQEENIQIAQLVQDGKLMYQMGKMDEAELKMKEALARDPNNQAALSYLSLIKQSTIRQVVDERNVASMNRMVQVEKEWADDNARNKLPSPNLYARTNTIYTSPQRQMIYEKINSIVFEKIAFPNLQLSEVIRNLTEQAQRRDIAQQGLNFLLE